ncbi:MAG: hypothetical protein ACD_16C00166G0008 [uncultured bacterium]|nr:MAG: hypothetical protein ACD_16C00166G0008 [uncultured bacterium]OFW69845.1 MAG: hypothetical protein A2X70_01475 [Alphaproteobacteria bacterium GWC2_42_16]OFW74424.1 MAG: hypothetical protein A2Z80_01400 [Alphaproteobacteria bacterium GWA2_41_27]OFW84565.1 MAG: hypothetical protein A3E50_07680 [Alphaproteobacteria bacterium RIFCSPHIGHO2_12_FULL_42_100]OFW86633.1 MAG: hypothetical protein A2W06_05535 [Alphaproteobacteria bacterium RBG_16_42_14]OFW91148.1 MAG: hypothetical protein A2W46_073
MEKTFFYTLEGLAMVAMLLLNATPIKACPDATDVQKNYNYVEKKKIWGWPDKPWQDSGGKCWVDAWSDSFSTENNNTPKISRASDKDCPSGYCCYNASNIKDESDPSQVLELESSSSC